MFDALEEFIISYATVLPLPVFAAIASFLEEVFAPIPSGPVMLAMGSIAQVQGYGLVALAVVAVCAALGKLAGALVVYVIADKAEDFLAGRFGKTFGITHEDIEKLGSKLGNGWKDYALLTVLRMLPFIPSAALSAGSGILKIQLRVFIFATFVGSIVRDAFFLYLGYIGFETAERILERFSLAETIGLVTIGIVAPSLIAFLYLRKRAERKAKES